MQREKIMDWIGETVFEFLLLLGVAVNFTLIRRVEKHLIQIGRDVQALQELKESRPSPDTV